MNIKNVCVASQGLGVKCLVLKFAQDRSKTELGGYHQDWHSLITFGTLVFRRRQKRGEEEGKS